MFFVLEKDSSPPACLDISIAAGLKANLDASRTQHSLLILGVTFFLQMSYFGSVTEQSERYNEERMQHDDPTTVTTTEARNGKNV